MASIPDMIVQEAQRQGVDPNLALAVAQRESNFDPKALNAASGDAGVFQLNMASWPGVNWWDPATNIRTGIGFLKQLIGKYGGDLQKVLAAYNWGPARVDAAVASQGTNWFSAIPSSVQSYASGIIQAAGAAVQSTAASLFGDAISLVPSPVDAALQPAATAVGGSLLLLGIIGLGAYWLFAD